MESRRHSLADIPTRRNSLGAGTYEEMPHNPRFPEDIRNVDNGASGAAGFGTSLVCSLPTPDSSPAVINPVSYTSDLSHSPSERCATHTTSISHSQQDHHRLYNPSRLVLYSAAAPLAKQTSVSSLHTILGTSPTASLPTPAPALPTSISYTSLHSMHSYRCEFLSLSQNTLMSVRR